MNILVLEHSFFIVRKVSLLLINIVKAEFHETSCLTQFFSSTLQVS